jgi:TPR repeat protein
MQNRPDSENPAQPSDDGVAHSRADAVAGHVEAQFGLAFSLAAGQQNYAEAADWYFKAADQDHRLAQFNLGQMFAQGQGVTRNDATAVMWFRRAANGGDAGAQFHLADRYGRSAMQGAKTSESESRIESYKWFKLAAAQGYGDALARSDSATLRMTHEEVTEGNRRVTLFGEGGKSV